MLPLFLRRPYKCFDCGARYYAVTSGHRTLQRARISLTALAIVAVSVFGIWMAISWLVTQKLLEESPPPDTLPRQK